MTAPIPPALTSDEWAHVRGEGIGSGTIPYFSLVDGVEAQIEGLLTGRDLARAAAVANAAREDDDPGKITREDVADCFAAALLVECGDCAAPDYATGARYRSLAAKLAALLPHA